MLDTLSVFKIYLEETVALSATTIKRYSNAINTISCDVESVTGRLIDIYSLENISDLNEIFDLFRTNPILKEKNERGQRFYTSALKKYKEFLLANKIGEFLKWNDRNGVYTHMERIKQEISVLSYQDAVILFYGVVNDDLYYNLVDNVFELDYREVIEVAKKNNVYRETEKKLEMLINNDKLSERFFRSLI